MKRICCLLVLVESFFACCSGHIDLKQATKDTLSSDILKNAAWAMAQSPRTVVDFQCERSAGGIHDFYSEGDYWWADPQNPDGPYIRRDGMTNPDNFIAHRLAMVRFSKIVGSLASAYVLTGNEDYVKAAFLHINAWFTNPDTRMNPDLMYAQAIKGVVTGRGVGIIDTVHLMEVAQSIMRMQKAKVIDDVHLKGVKAWFAEYISWLMKHPYGVDEMNAQNNHGTCWVMQVASFARLTDNVEVLDFCRSRYKNILLPQQTADDGSFPREMARTKPYGYSLFNLDAMATICQILSTPQDNLWEYETQKGVSVRKAIDYMVPYIKNKSAWTLPPDVMYWDEWPMAQPSLVFAAIAYSDTAYFDVWKKYQHQSDVEEVERNMPIRNPIIWI